MHRELSKLAYIIPVITILLALAVFIAVPEGGEAREILIVVFATMIFVIVLLELVLLLGYVISFLFTRNSICLTYGDGSLVIEFWKTRKVSRLIGDFEKGIRERQDHIQESEINPLTRVFEIRNVYYIRRLILLSSSFCAPAVLLQMPVLLVLGLIPIAWYIFTTIRLMGHPKEYRKAIQRYRRKDWNGAIFHLKSLLVQSPDYISAKFFLIEIYLREERFDEALEMVGSIPDEYLFDSNALYLEIWSWKRIHIRRKEPM
jgi:hypothetical protein